ncbi:hypothetical protein HanHA300_Chr12g0448781 [Helianthus annuus]|nr:hypothetical protein HanHA300_Chr12g0448781 [Helianthus annuus]KAJ0493871.1 hypothetical protein HanIR_Chr12g0590971 [Helianthus annuus]KAJ0505773.1 hypothetical protein HanHA89_Chr12g0474261 [Helianthus annuus]KAJ0675443.1 hypothetical protein HanLR1_Chr12g0451211 [Helianthus annuus]
MCVYLRGIFVNHPYCHICHIYHITFISLPHNCLYSFLCLSRILKSDLKSLKIFNHKTQNQTTIIFKAKIPIPPSSAALPLRHPQPTLSRRIHHKTPSRRSATRPHLSLLTLFFKGLLIFSETGDKVIGSTSSDRMGW